MNIITESLKSCLPTEQIRGGSQAPGSWTSPPRNCNPANNDQTCCTSSAQCSLGEGDCDYDSDCSGDLICGDNNCSAGESIMDCCASNLLHFSTSGVGYITFGILDVLAPPKNCTASNNDQSCCSQSSPCGLREGDCDHDDECAGDLICGDNNCAAGDSDMDCCTSK